MKKKEKIKKVKYQITIRKLLQNDGGEGIFYKHVQIFKDHWPYGLSFSTRSFVEMTKKGIDVEPFLSKAMLALIEKLRSKAPVNVARQSIDDFSKNLVKWRAINDYRDSLKDVLNTLLPLTRGPLDSIKLRKIKRELAYLWSDNKYRNTLRDIVAVRGRG